MRLGTMLAMAAERHLGSRWAHGIFERTLALDIIISTADAATLQIEYPFHVHGDHHCESSLLAYQHIASFLDLVASQLGKNRSRLSIFDPYFCATALKEHL